MVLVTLKKTLNVVFCYGASVLLECNEEYIGESARAFGERFREHQKDPSQFMTIVTPQVIPLHWIISV